MESISQRALRDATCPNRFPVAVGVRRAGRLGKGKAGGSGFSRKTGIERCLVFSGALQELPVFDWQARNSAELGRIVGYQDESACQGNRGDHQIIGPDRGS